MLIGKHADTIAQFRACNGADLVDHDPRRRAQAIALIGLDQRAEDFAVVHHGGETAQDDRSLDGKQIGLDDQPGTRLSGIIGAARRRPDLAALHAGLEPSVAGG